METGWSRYSKDATIPKFAPPPFRPQRSSGCTAALAVTTRPSALTTSAESSSGFAPPALAGSRSGSTGTSTSERTWSRARLFPSNESFGAPGRSPTTQVAGGEVFEVVENEQELPFRQDARQALGQRHARDFLDADGLRDGGRNQTRVAQGAELYEENAVGEARLRCFGSPERKPRLARAAGTLALRKPPG